MAAASWIKRCSYVKRTQTSKLLAHNLHLETTNILKRCSINALDDADDDYKINGSTNSEARHSLLFRYTDSSNDQA